MQLGFQGIAAGLGLFLAGPGCVLDFTPVDPYETETAAVTTTVGTTGGWATAVISAGDADSSVAESDDTGGQDSDDRGAADTGSGPEEESSAASSSDDDDSDGDASTGENGDGPPFILGADISSVHERDDKFRDTDGQIKSIFELLKNHGFNYIRVKTFVDPMAPYGFASSENGCPGLAEPFSDRDHVVAFGREIKAAGMGFLLVFHYSDIWADPGNQIIPAAWRDSADIDALAEHVRRYTTDVVTTAIEAGARPDMIQIGNEITPGMLMHVPGPNTDCWGNNPVPAPFGGAAGTTNWPNLALLLDTAIQAVRAVDPTIEIMLHLENTDSPAGIRWWVGNARLHGVDFDLLGLSCYTVYQGEPEVWESTFEGLARDYPDLEFVIAEYNPERTAANLIMKNLYRGRGRGTFIWEPTSSGRWGPSMFRYEDGAYVADEAAFAEFDALRPQLGL